VVTLLEAYGVIASCVVLVCVRAVFALKQENQALLEAMRESDAEASEFSRQAMIHSRRVCELEQPSAHRCHFAFDFEHPYVIVDGKMLCVCPEPRCWRTGLIEMVN
jgi:hypothetical protein